MKTLFAVIVIAAMLSAWGCDKPHKPQASEPPAVRMEQPAQQQVKLGQADDGSTHIVAVGGEVTVVLNEDPSKKNKWVIVDKPGHLTLTDESKKTFSPTNQDRRFVFTAKAGSGWLTIHYRDDGWKAGSPVLASVSFYIVAK